MQEISHSGVFIKRFDSREHTEMKPHALATITIS